MCVPSVLEIYNIFGDTVPQHPRLLGINMIKIAKNETTEETEGFPLITFL